MLNLSQQIAPSLAARQPSPDQTFGAYVRELLATSKGFGGPFAGGQNQQQTQATPQTKIVDGLFGKFLPESGDSGGDYSSSPSSSPIGVGTMTDAINQQALQGMLGLGLGYMGVPGMTTKGLEGLYSAFTAPGDVLDAVNQAADPLGALAGVQNWTEMNPAYDPWSGTSSYDSSGAYGGASVDNMGAGGYVDAAMGGGYGDYGGGYGSGGGDSTSNDGPSNDGGHNSSGD